MKTGFGYLDISIQLIPKGKAASGNPAWDKLLNSLKKLDTS